MNRLDEPPHLFVIFFPWFRFHTARNIHTVRMERTKPPARRSPGVNPPATIIEPKALAPKTKSQVNDFPVPPNLSGEHPSSRNVLLP
jgi:hypothetical protein